MDREFKSFERRNKVTSKINRIWSFLEKRGIDGIVDKMAVPNDYVGRIVMTGAQTNAFIKEGIENGGGFVAGRMGAVELNYVYYYLREQMGCKDGSKLDAAIKMLCFNAGFFPNESAQAQKFAKLYLESIAQMDICGVWGVFMEDYMLHRYAPDTAITRLRCLEPWVSRDCVPWSKSLNGKKLLVVHPFVETMKQQYEKKDEIFKNRFGSEEILPDMEVSYVKAVQSIGGEGAPGFKSWFEAYDYMVDKIRKIDFDVAILGCGAYGLPIAARIKEMGKTAIHLGGATQLMFGIKGKRWNDDPLISSLYNESWVSPSDIEKPQHADGVENGCYW